MNWPSRYEDAPVSVAGTPLEQPITPGDPEPYINPGFTFEAEPLECGHCGIKDDPGGHWWLKKGMREATVMAMCEHANGRPGMSHSADRHFGTRVAKANTRFARKVIRDSLKTTKHAVDAYAQSANFTFRFHVEHDSAKAAKACVALGKMGVDPDGLIFGEALG